MGGGVIMSRRSFNLECNLYIHWQIQFNSRMSATPILQCMRLVLPIFNLHFHATVGSHVARNHVALILILHFWMLFATEPCIFTLTIGVIKALRISFSI